MRILYRESHCRDCREPLFVSICDCGYERPIGDEFYVVPRSMPIRWTEYGPCPRVDLGWYELVQVRNYIRALELGGVGDWPMPSDPGANASLRAVLNRLVVARTPPPAQQVSGRATMPRDARDLFDNLVPQGLSQYPDRARSIEGIFCFKISGCSADGGCCGGEWTIDCTVNPPSCRPGDSGHPHVTVEVSNADFATMLGDPNAGMQLYFEGRLRVSGDPMYAMKLQQLFEIARPGQ